jgi:phosphoglycerol transferase MdoB-like AlkP superfamily enzyme
MGLSDKEFFRQTTGKLLSLEEPFMAFLITLSTHHPYSDFKNDSSLNLGDFKGTLLGSYINAVHYFDSAFGKFTEILLKNGLLNKSVVVLYGDHKGEIGETSEIKRLLQKYDPEYEHNWKDYYYWINLNRLPLLIHLPNDELAGIRDITCGHLDIANTIFDILGINNAQMVSFGRNLMLNKDSFVLFNNGSFLDKDTLFITADGQISTAKVYNLENGSRLNPNSFKDKADRLWEELEASNLIIRGDLIPGK